MRRRGDPFCLEALGEGGKRGDKPRQVRRSMRGSRRWFPLGGCFRSRNPVG
jgi:hypothetical protein